MIATTDATRVDDRHLGIAELYRHMPDRYNNKRVEMFGMRIIGVDEVPQPKKKRISDTNETGKRFALLESIIVKDKAGLSRKTFGNVESGENK